MATTRKASTPTRAAQAAKPAPRTAKRPATTASSGPRTEGFAYTREQLRGLVDEVLGQARKLGASDAACEVSEGSGLSVGVRLGEVENVERNRDKSIGVTVYIGQRRGNASTSDFSSAAIARTVQAAYDIARYTAEDDCAGLPDEADLALGAEAERDLDLYHPWAIDSEGAVALALRCEAAALGLDPRVSNSDGASVSAQQAHFMAGNTRGFRGGYASSRHSVSVAPIVASGDEMQRDAWYSSMRHAGELAAPEAVGRYAAERALARLGSRKIATAEVPVLFESTLAAGLLGSFVQAVSGGSLYRKTSFLEGCLGQRVFAEHLDLDEDPHVLRGKGSTPFDDEGVRTRARRAVDGGVVQGYFLGSYSARKLGMKTTGHAGGSQNLAFTSRLTRPGDDLPAMLKKLHRGLFVVELMGQGVNMVTGDYSRGAAGFWVENGELAYPVHEITIAGHLREMFQRIVAVGADAYTTGSKTVGSVLVEGMKLAGH